MLTAPSNTLHRSAPQHGQALTEFLAVATALIPLFVLIPIIAKYQDINHATQMAARYAAFDATLRNDGMSTWKSPDELAQEIRRRFFSNPDAPIKTDDAAGNFKAHQNMFLRDPQDKALIADFDKDIQVHFGPSNGDAHDAAYSAASDGSPFTLRDPLDLKSRGIYSVNVSVALANLPDGIKILEPFNALDLSITRSTSLIIDGWTAKNPSRVEERIARDPSIFPVGALADVSDVTQGAVLTMDWPGGVLGPRLGELEFWRDVVPRDRLKRNQ